MGYITRKQLSRFPPELGSRTNSILLPMHPAAEYWEADHPTQTKNIYGLTFRQEIFCIKWTAYDNITMAYQDAYGGSLRNANINGHRLARQRNIQLWKQRITLQRQLSSFDYPEEDFMRGISELAAVEVEGVQYYLRMIDRWNKAASMREEKKRNSQK